MPIEEDHRRSSTSRMRAKSSVSMSLSTRSPRPPPSSIITMLAFLRGRETDGGSAGIAGAGSASTTSTGTSCGMDGAEIWQSSLRRRAWAPAGGDHASHVE